VKRKRVPMRTCVGCRRTAPKRELLRVVRTPDGEVEVDLTGKKSGRGAYLCGDPACLEATRKKGILARALKVEIPADVYDQLRELCTAEDEPHE